MHGRTLDSPPAFPDRFPSKAGFLVLEQAFPERGLESVHILAARDPEAPGVREALDRLTRLLAADDAFGTTDVRLSGDRRVFHGSVFLAVDPESVGVLSMDYQVFLLSRIKERWDRTEDTPDAIAHGVASTGRLITGAALVIIAVFAGFASGDLVMFQQMGFGVGVALLVDATIVRLVLVPAAMRLLGDWNWYLRRRCAGCRTSRWRVTSRPGAPRSFRSSPQGNTWDMFKWRYALLGWLAWAIGKRVLRRKLHLARR